MAVVESHKILNMVSYYTAAKVCCSLNSTSKVEVGFDTESRIAFIHSSNLYLVPANDKRPSQSLWEEIKKISALKELNWHSSSWGTGNMSLSHGERRVYNLTTGWARQEQMSRGEGPEKKATQGTPVPQLGGAALLMILTQPSQQPCEVVIIILTWQMRKLRFREAETWQSHRVHKQRKGWLHKLWGAVQSENKEFPSSDSSVLSQTWVPSKCRVLWVCTVWMTAKLALRRDTTKNYGSTDKGRRE